MLEDRMCCIALFNADKMDISMVVVGWRIAVKDDFFEVAFINFFNRLFIVQAICIIKDNDQYYIIKF